MKRASLVVAILLLLPVVLFVIYLVGANVFLNLPAGRRVMNSHPEVVHVRFGKAWTVWPGRVHVTYAQITGQDPHTQFEVTADQAVMSFSPRGIADKIVTGGNIRGHGMTVRIRTRRVAMPSPEEMARLPEITDYPSPMRDPGPDVLPNVGVRLQDIDVQDVREVWVDDYRFVGVIDVRGGLYLKPYKALRIYPVDLRVRSGTISLGTSGALRDVPIVASLTGTIRGSVDQIDMTKAGRKDLRLASGAIDLRATFADLRFVNSLLDLPDVSIREGSGELSLGVNLNEGTLAAGTKVDLLVPQLAATLPEFGAKASVHVGLTVDEAKDHALFSVEFGALALSHHSESEPVVKAASLRIHGHTNTLDLTRTQQAVARLDLPSAEATDLRFLNHYVPADDKVRIKGGHAHLSAHFNLDTAKRHADGLLDLRGSKLLVDDGTAHLDGGAKIHLVLDSLHLDTLEADLTGTSLMLDDVEIVAGGKTTKGWWGGFELAKTVIRPHGKPLMETTVSLGLKNLQPAVGVIAASVPIPWIAQALANQPNANAGAHLVLTHSTLTLTGLKLTAGVITAQANLHAYDLDKKTMRDDGYALLQWQAVVVGLDIHDKAVKGIIVSPRAWYEAKVAALGNH